MSVDVCEALLQESPRRESQAKIASCTITPAVTPAPTCNLSTATLQMTNDAAQPVTVNVSTTGPVTTSAVPHVVFPPGAMPLLWTVILLGLGLLVGADLQGGCQPWSRQ
jgi:hypothetical protein